MTCILWARMQMDPRGTCFINPRDAVVETMKIPIALLAELSDELRLIGSELRSSALNPRVF